VAAKGLGHHHGLASTGLANKIGPHHRAHFSTAIAPAQRIAPVQFSHEAPSTPLRRTLEILRLIFHTAVREVRKTHGNAVIGLSLAILQTVGLLAAFYLMFAFTGFRAMAPRGDYIVYLLSGIFLYFVHVRALTAVATSEGPTSAIMKHSPMTTTIAIGGAALGVLYLQLLSVVVILLVYHAAFVPVVLDDVLGCLGMLLFAWFSGAALGMVFAALQPWAPGGSALLRSGYMRISMIASGQMFLANMLPPGIRSLMDWHPLFHIIDQARGYAFLNYVPHHTELLYPLWITLGLLMLGLLAEFYTRQRASISWSARMLGQ
jgi:ABC-type polysaccharide/polyol phosphate export permease